MDWYHLRTGQFGYPQPTDIYNQVTYDPSAGCSTCEIGKRQRAPFRFIKEPKLANKAFTGLNWIFDEVLVIDTMRSSLEKEGLSGATYSRPVTHRTGKAFENWSQMHVDTILQGAVMTDGMPTERCEKPRNRRLLGFLRAGRSRLETGPFCGAVKFNWPQGVPFRLRESALDGAPDLVRSSEWFGSGGSGGRAIFASERIVEFVRAQRLRGLFFDRAEFC